MDSATDILIRKLKEHTRLSPEDVAAIGALSHSTRSLAPNEDIVHQGDKPKISMLVVSGMVARYHTRSAGSRQYISFHISGDMPDSQSLFLDQMDHSVCAIGSGTSISEFPHHEILRLFETRPSAGYAFWRETLIDAAIFREAITNNSSRPVRARIAHFMCEQFYRARAAGLGAENNTRLPISQTQLGETLGISVVTVNRALQALRRTGAMEFRDGTLTVRNWEKLTALGEFDPRYLHLTRQNRI
jgi:CRP-like cAMP-binding protein